MLDVSMTTVGTYRLGASLGAGETGELFEAHDAAEQPALVKVVRDELAGDPAFRAALRMQAAALRQLRHQNIVAVHEVKTQEGECFVAMEWLPDGTLRDLLRRGDLERLTLPERLQIAHQAALALAHAHDLGFLHGSVTPDDLFLLREGGGLRVKLADLGVAWLAIHSEEMTAAWSDSLVYAMPPERCQGLDLDQRGDLYALGVILYELVTGEPPFAPDTLDTAVFLHVYTQPQPPHERVAELPPALEEIILRCLAKSPEQRFATAAELARALEPFLPPPPEPEVAEPPEAPAPAERLAAAEAELAADPGAEVGDASGEQLPPAAEVPTEEDQGAEGEPPLEEGQGAEGEPRAEAVAEPAVLPGPRRRRPATPRAPLELVGRTVGGYELKTYLGASETGDVYRGVHTESGGTAAVKIIHDALAYDQFFETGFAEQTALLAALQHPQLVTTLEAGSDDEFLFAAMEWLPDGTLRNLLQRRGEGDAMPLRLGLELIRQTAVGLEYIHALRLVHGGIKPNNLLLQRRGDGQGAEYSVKIGDTILAWLGLHSDSGLEIWPDTLIYAMPPERCQGLELDHRADLYALGVILYEIATGSPPFEAKTLDAAVYRHVYTEPIPPRQIAPALPPALEQIILRCLAKRPADRFPTAAALAAALQELLETEALAPRPQLASLILAPSSAPAIDGPFTPQVSALDQYGRGFAARELTGEGLRIGRAPDNDIVLQSEAVEPRHLQLDWDGTSVLATNISTKSEASIGGSGLAPGETRQWAWDAPMRLGPFWLRVEVIPVTEGRPSAPAVAPESALAEDEPRRQEPAEPEVSPERLSPRIGVGLDQEALTLTPGRPATFRVNLANLGNLVDHFTVSVEQIPQQWIVGPPPVVQLNPGAQGVVTLNVLVPQSPEHRAGIYPATIRVRSRESANESNIAPAVWTVQPYASSSFDMRPKRLRRRLKGRYRVTVRNSGNAPARYALSAADDDEALGYQFAQDVLALEPGASASTQLIVRPLRAKLYGRSEIHSFNVRMRPADAEGEPSSTMAQFEQAAVVPRWSLALLTLVLAAVAVGMWLRALPAITDLAAVPNQPVNGEPFVLRWGVENATSLELRVNGTVVPLRSGADQIAFRGISSPAEVELTARNLMLGRDDQLLQIVPISPTPAPTGTPAPTAEPLPTDPPPPEPPPPPAPTQEAPPPTSGPEPTPTSQTLCATGRTAEILVEGGPREPYLVHFGSRIVTGGRLGDDGRGVVRLGPINEAPGRYLVEVRSRDTGVLLRRLTCVVP
jgi:serine/threonine protein kinase